MVHEVTKKYSQQDEQQYILEACQNSTRKTLLDIGAWDPFEFSNSRALIEMGWKAVLVEPSPGPLQKLLAEYGHSETVKIVAAIAQAEPTAREIVRMNITDDAVSTTEESEYSKWKNTAKFLGTLYVGWVSIVSLIEIAQPDFVNIDAEGTSIDLFQKMIRTFQYWGQSDLVPFELPRCICVEHNSHSNLLLNQASSLGYKLAHLNDTNLIISR